MTERHILDFRVGTPWSASDHGVMAKAARSAWANPSHPSSEGRRAATWLEAAQATVRELSGLPHVSFHADREAAVRAVVDTHPRLHTSAAATHRRRLLARVDSVVPVDDEGHAEFPSSELVFLQAANEETGVIDAAPQAAVSVLDASMAFGRTELAQGADHVIADATAWGCPVGIAIVMGRLPLTDVDPPPLPLVTLAVQTLASSWDERLQRSAQELAAIQEFESRVGQRIPDVQFHGRTRVPHIRSFSVLHLDAETLMRELDTEGFVVGSGSACVSDGTPSHVLAAMGRITHGNLRLALPLGLDLEVLDHFAGVLESTVATLRRRAGVDAL